MNCLQKIGLLCGQRPFYTPYILDFRPSGHRRIYHWATWAMTLPPLNCEKKSRGGKKMQPKCAIFRQKSQTFSGEGAQPRPQTLPPLEKEIPLTRHSPSAHLTLSAATLDLLQNFFPISIITLDCDAVIDEFGKSNRRLVFTRHSCTGRYC